MRLACERHLRDLETGPVRGLRWDGRAARRAIEFFSLLRLPCDDKLDGQPFTLQPSQAFIVGSLDGWKGEDGYRRFRTAYVEQGKGSGKSPTAAGLGLKGLIADGEAAAEIYAAATTRDQATVTFRDAKRIAEASPALSKRLDVGAHNIHFPATDSFFRPVSAEHRGLDGKRPHMALIDEVHEHPTPLVVDKMRAGTKGRRQALIFMITNSGYDRTTVCWSLREYSVKVLEGILEDDSWFAYVCSLDPCEACRAQGFTQPKDGCKECDDWKDESVWEKANPTIDTVLPRKYLREQVREAVGRPDKEGIVKRLNFCIWTQGESHAIPMDKWDACKRLIDLEALKGRQCFGGLDIGATSDFTAFTLLFPHDDAQVIEVPADPEQPDGDKKAFVRRSYSLVPYFWLPEHPVRRDERMTLLIDSWRRQGFVKTTGGEVVDYDEVLRDIVKLSDEYSLDMIAFDRGFQGASMGTSLLAHFGDSRVVAFAQGILSMAAPFRELVELIVQNRLHHNGNPILRWMASNTAAEQRGGLVKPSKEKSAEKIDGITSLTMALGVAMSAEPAWTYTPGGLLS